MTAKKLPTPHKINGEMLSECAATQATFAEQMKQVTANLDRITDIILGNGKLGLQDKTDGNSRALETVIKLLDSMRLDKQSEEIRLKEVAAERKRDIRKWWLGVAGTAVFAAIAIIQAVSTQAALKALELTVK
jgi:hypothetical protein